MCLRACVCMCMCVGQGVGVGVCMCVCVTMSSDWGLWSWGSSVMWPPARKWPLCSPQREKWYSRIAWCVGRNLIGKGDCKGSGRLHGMGCVDIHKARHLDLPALLFGSRCSAQASKQASIFVYEAKGERALLQVRAQYCRRESNGLSATMNVHAHTCTRAHVHTRAHTHTRTHAHTHTHSNVCAAEPHASNGRPAANHSKPVHVAMEPEEAARPAQVRTVCAHACASWLVYTCVNTSVSVCVCARLRVMADVYMCEYKCQCVCAHAFASWLMYVCVNKCVNVCVHTLARHCRCMYV